MSPILYIAEKDDNILQRCDDDLSRRLCILRITTCDCEKGLNEYVVGLQCR